MDKEVLIGKVIESIYAYSGEVDITFTDGTRLYIELEMVPDISYYRSPYQDCSCIPQTINLNPYFVVDKKYHNIEL